MIKYLKLVTLWFQKRKKKSYKENNDDDKTTPKTGERKNFVDYFDAAAGVGATASLVIILSVRKKR